MVSPGGSAKAVQDHHIGGAITVELLDRIHLNEVIVLASGDDNILAAFGPQLFNYEGSKKACPTGDDDPLI